MALAPFLFCSCGGLSKSDRETVEILPVGRRPGEVPVGGVAPIPDAAPVEPAEPPYSLENAQEYVIQSGDSLSAISDKFGVSVRDIKAANKIADANKIRAGQTLLLPGDPEDAKPDESGESSTEAVPAGGGESSALELPGVEAGQ